VFGLLAAGELVEHIAFDEIDAFFEQLRAFRIAARCFVRREMDITE